LRSEITRISPEQDHEKSDLVWPWKRRESKVEPLRFQPRVRLEIVAKAMETQVETKPCRTQYRSGF
jgi:hypothetical protein